MARYAPGEEVYNAAVLFRDRCLSEGRSLLWPNAHVWTPENLTTLYDAYIGHPDAGKRSFLEKWGDQLRDLPEDIHRLAADAIAVYHLFPMRVKEETKLRDIETIVKWKLASDPPDTGVVEKAFARGVASPGTHYQTGRPWQIAYILDFARRIIAGRIDVHDFESCRRVADESRAHVAQSTEMRQIMLHLLFPERFERIASTNHKDSIVRAFESDSGGATDRDDALWAIRQAMPARLGRQDFDFYDQDVRPLWQVGSSKSSLQESFESILENYDEIRTSQPFTTNKLIWHEFERLRTLLQGSESVKKHPSLQIKWSVGTGNWATVPWLAALDSRETTTTQDGIYVVYLFRADMSGVYLTLNQGVTKPRNAARGENVRDLLRERAREIRLECGDLSRHGFLLDDGIDLQASTTLGSDYEASTIAYKFYETTKVPSDEALLSDADALLDVYGSIMDRRHEATSRAWVFQANPQMWDLAGRDMGVGVMRFCEANDRPSGIQVLDANPRPVLVLDALAFRILVFGQAKRESTRVPASSGSPVDGQSCQVKR